MVYGGNSTCVEVTLLSGKTVVIDAGTGMRRLGDELVARKDLDLTLLMTHIHWDHVVGFPFFAPIFHPNTRIVVDGCRRSVEGLRKVFSANFLDGTWPIRFDDLKARIQSRHELLKGSLRLDDTLIESHQLQHPQGGQGFKFTEPSGVFVFLTDNELTDNGWHGSSFKDFVRFCRDADLLVHDCQYLPEEMDVRQGWGHSDIAAVARLAREADVKRLVLFHHDPWRKDREISRMVVRCQELLGNKQPFITVTAAQEDTTLVV